MQKFNRDINTTAFEMTDREHFTYNNGGTKEIFGISYKFNGSVWNPEIRFNKTYDGFNNIIDKIFETYDPVFTTWNLGNRTLYTYDDSQNIVTIEEASSSDGGTTISKKLIIK